LSAYADTSFLVSLYTLDVNSPSAARLMRHAKLRVAITPLGELELVNAFQLRVFRKELTPSEARASAALFRQDLEAGVFEMKPLSPTAFERAKHLVRKRSAVLGTRTLDLLHVASALALQSDVFYTFDQHQLKLAKAEGLALA
jgi:predicted nucleic acid-binding protein